MVLLWRIFTTISEKGFIFFRMGSLKINDKIAKEARICIPSSTDSSQNDWIPESHLLELLNSIKSSSVNLKNTTCAKLKMISEQISFLQKQAEMVYKEYQLAIALSECECNFVKKSGSIYYCYQRSNSSKFLSLLSPEEWGVDLTASYIGSYRYEADSSWTPLEEIEIKEKNNRYLENVFDSLSSHNSRASILLQLTEKKDDLI